MFRLLKNIMLVAAEDTTIKRAAGFTGSMFTVNGGNLQMAGGSVTDSNGTAIGSGSLTLMDLVMVLLVLL